MAAGQAPCLPIYRYIYVHTRMPMMRVVDREQSVDRARRRRRRRFARAWAVVRAALFRSFFAHLIILYLYVYTVFARFHVLCLRCRCMYIRECFDTGCCFSAAFVYSLRRLQKERDVEYREEDTDFVLIIQYVARVT